MTVLRGALLLAMPSISQGSFAQAEFEPLLCMRGEVLVADDFENLGAIPERWFFREEWTVAEGAMTRTDVAGKNRRVFIRKPRYRDCIIELKFAFRGASEIRIMTGTPGKYNAVVILWPHGFRVTTARDQSAPHFPTIHGECAQHFEPNRFYSFMMEIRGPEILVRVGDDEHVVVGRHPILARERDYFALQVDQPGATFDDVRLTSANGEGEGWPATRKKLGRHQLVRPWLPHDAEEQRRVRETIARDKLYRSSEEFREKVARVESMKKLAAQAYPEVFWSVKERRKKIDLERRRLLEEDPVYRALREGINKLKRAEVEMLHLLHSKLKDLPEAQYHLALAKARAKAKETTAFQMVVANREVTEARMRVRYPQLEKSNEDLLAEGRAARVEVAATPEFKAICGRIADAVRSEKIAVAEVADSLRMTFAKTRTNK